LIIMLFLLISLLKIYLNLNIGKNKVTDSEKWLVHIPFSVYLGWITVATIANTTIFLVSLGWDGQPLSPAIWAVVTIVAAISVNIWTLFSRRDFAFALVGIWALW